MSLSITKRELVARLEVPRSTLDDVVRELAGAGLAEYVDGAWALTAVGRCARQRYESYAERIDGLAAAAAVLQDAPSAEIDCAMLDGCAVFETEEVLPDRSVLELTERVRDAETFRGLVPQALAGHVPSIHDAVFQGPHTTVELVFDPQVYAGLVEMYPDLFEEALEPEHVTHFRGQIPVPYGLWIIDDEHVGVVVYGDGGVEGIIVNDSAAALDWANRLYDDVQADAEPVTASP